MHMLLRNNTHFRNNFTHTFQKQMYTHVLHKQLNVFLMWLQWLVSYKESTSMHSGQTHRWFISSSNVRCRSLLFQLYAWDKPIRFISTYIPLPGTATKWVHSIHDILEKILKSILIIFFSWAFYLPMKQRSSTNSRSAQQSVANSCNFLYALLILLMSLISFMSL